MDENKMIVAVDAQMTGAHGTIDCQIEQLQLRIKELESQSNIINQAIADYLENDLLDYANLYDANHAVSVEHIEYSINKLRNKYD